MQKNKFFYILSFLFLILLDQISKYIIRTKGGFYICNENLAFGLSPHIIISAILLIALFLFIYNLKFKIINLKSISNLKFQISNYKTQSKIIALLILSGAIANIIDRLYLGCVIDFIDLKFWPVFNFADIYITIGVIILLIRTRKYV
ncbi:MAG: Lipoprotein signal peptidase [Candidatus Moranbacteria bacterium GW2011_GWF2_36_839]|nr:MAG: Lipoprotein signal peptidase [Candidatus Moranbacteria bacterium GW2011_GWF1_36_78]KKQ17207.1 MAG: Lipoprotein signal peptidase [Candidatus Moranbacteria bacterium GW2011_GWF2_36_839]HAT73725.1 hypothetical protein [Candidatus Moranbacteria bacterium]HBY11286.1 hypothetical protein [Candidatus Moranbacteria bacterium]